MTHTTPVNALFSAQAAGLIAAVFCTFGWFSAGFAQDASSLKCAQLLSADQVKQMLGAGMAAALPRQYGAGESECVWRRGNGPTAASLSVRYFDRQAIGSNPVARTLDGYYEMLVKAGEEAADKKREPVVGVPRASLIQVSPQVLVVVQRSDGVARVVLANLSRAQATAVAKQIAAP